MGLTIDVTDPNRDLAGIGSVIPEKCIFIHEMTLLMILFSIVFVI